MARCFVFAVIVFSLVFGDIATAQNADRHDWCNYPRKPQRRAFRSLEAIRFQSVDEQEPNNTTATAQTLALGFGDTEDIDIDVNAAIDGDDVDVFSINGVKGATLGLACLGNASLDTVVTLLDDEGEVLLENDQHLGMADLYPVQSPFPAGGQQNDSALTFTFPDSGEHFVRVSPYGLSEGSYRLQLRIRKPKMHSHQLNSRQIIYLDFGNLGKARINAKRLFGSGGNPDAELTEFSEFLPRWGLAASDENAVIDSIIENVTRHFTDPHLSGINDLDTSSTSEHGSYGVAIRNSRDHGNLSGNANVTRIIVGGTIAELGIQTIGIAQHIDPGNFATEDTAVVLLDLLSVPAGSPNAANSINSFTLAPGFSKIDAIGRVVGAVISHEAGHTFGCWHCENSNDQASLMDQGGNLPNTAGVGPDGMLGSDDDVDVRFRGDLYANEGISEAIPPSRENVDARVAFALSTGTLDASTFLLVAERDLLRARVNLMNLERASAGGIPGAPLMMSMFTEGLQPDGAEDSAEIDVTAAEARADAVADGDRTIPSDILRAAEFTETYELQAWREQIGSVQNQLDRLRESERAQ